MHKNKTIGIVVLSLLLVLLGFGVTRLFILRFEIGDVYPASSSLRSDPLGTRALYESLANLENVRVKRNFIWRDSTSFEPRTALFYLGASANEFESIPGSMMGVFDRLTQSGGRLIISFQPVTRKNDREAPQTSDTEQGEAGPGASSEKRSRTPNRTSGDGKPSAGESPEKSETPGADDCRSADTEGAVPMVSIKKHWGLDIAFKDMLPVKDDKRLPIDATTTHRGLPAFISWHSNLYFELSDDAWQTLYSFEGLPLIVERPYGNGSIVLCADSYFVSNEALLSERHTRLLVWLIGGHTNLVFDEAHHGLYKQPSVAQLIRHYRFHWFFAVLAVLALLFVWKNAVYFIPPSASADKQGPEVVSEKDYTQGLIALLRRNFSGDQILQICVREWVQTFKKNRRIRAGTLKRVRDLAERGSADSIHDKDPVRTYQNIGSLINRLGIHSQSRGKF